MWDHFKDPGNCAIAKVLFDDMANLDKIGLNGMVSCQCVRSFFPHGLGMNAMATALWNRDADYDAVARDYFAKAFGADGGEVQRYMQALSDCADPVFVRGEHDPAKWKELIPGMEQAQALVSGFRPVIQRHLNDDDKAVALSYHYLSLHADFAQLYLTWEISMAGGESEKAETDLQALLSFADDHEKDLFRVFDSHIFKSTMTNCAHKLKSALENA